MSPWDTKDEDGGYSSICPSRPAPSLRPDYSLARPPSIHVLSPSLTYSNSVGAKVPFDRELMSCYGLARKVLPKLGFDANSSGGSKAFDEVAQSLAKRMAEVHKLDDLHTGSEVMLAQRELVMMIGEAVCEPQAIGAPTALLDQVSPGGQVAVDQEISDLVVSMLEKTPGDYGWFDPKPLAIPAGYRETWRHGCFLAYAADELHLQHHALTDGLAPAASSMAQLGLANFCSDRLSGGRGGWHL